MLIELKPNVYHENREGVMVRHLALVILLMCFKGPKYIQIFLFYSVKIFTVSNYCASLSRNIQMAIVTQLHAFVYFYTLF